MEGDLDEALAEARDAGVSDVIAMGVDAVSSRRAARWAEAKPGVWAAAGHHPLNLEGPDLKVLRELAVEPRVVAIGEVGLDHADEHRGPRAAQLDWFHACCDLALEASLPVCVHVRETEAEVLGVLRAHPGLKGVMHYWTLDWEWAQRFLELGFHISFSGVVTRATRTDLREVAARVPAERLLLETDAPWGTPRGRSGRMRPAWIVDTARVVAEARGLGLEELAELEARNAHALFTRLGARPGS